MTREARKASARRILHSTRRRVEAGRESEYLRAWARLAATMEALDAHAWLFRSADDDRDFMEFLEYAGDANPLMDEDVVAARATLERDFSPGRVELWEGVS